MFAGLCLFALPATPAFGEGSFDVNQGPDPNSRHGLVAASTGNYGGPGSDPYTVLYVYAQAGETIQLGSSAMGVAGAGNIQVYNPGTTLEGLAFPSDPAFANDVFNCDTDDAGTGVIANGAAGRAQEIAGPLPNAGGYDPCEFTPTTTGIFPVIITSPDPGVTADGAGTVGVPDQSANSQAVAIWDVTVRNASGVQPGRLFSNQFVFWETTPTTILSGGVRVFPYTRTGYEYQVDMFNHNGAGWSLRADDEGIVDTATGDRLFSSFDCRLDPADPANACTDTRGGFAAQSGRYPLFVNQPDPIVISGPGGLAATRGYETAPITPASNPLTGTFTGSGGQGGATNRGAGGTVDVTSPSAMAGLGSTLEIDLDRNGTFGDGPDYVDTQNLEADGSNAYAWNGQDAAGNVPACGDYPYRVRSTLAEVHFPMYDVESSGGTQIQRLSFPGDPTLGDALAASYDDRDPFKNRDVTDANPIFADDELSGSTFHAWGDENDAGDIGGGDTDYMDTWAQLPEVQTTGTLQVLCNDPGIVKSGPATVAPGGQVTWTMTITNHGPGTSSGSTVEDSIPAGVTNVSTPTPGCSVAGGKVTCAVGQLAAGASTEVTVTGTAPSTPSTCFTNTATVAGQDDHNAANNTATWTTCTDPPPPGPAAVSLDKTASDNQVLVGETVTYTMVAKNNGPGVATDVNLGDTVPSRLDVQSVSSTQGSCSVSGNRVSCALGTMTVGQTVTITVRARAIEAGGTTNKATVDSKECTTHPCDEDPAKVTIVEPKLRISKQVSKREIRAGQTVGYTIRVSNPSDVAIRNVRTCDRLPAGLVYVSAKPKAKLSGGQHCWTVKRLAAGASRTYKVTVRALPGASGKLVNRATATAPDAKTARAKRAVRVEPGALLPDVVTG